MLTGAVALGTLVVPAAATAAPSDQVRVGSFNIDRPRAFDRWRGAVRALQREVDVAGLQEVSTDAKRRFLTRQGWNAHGTTPGPDENPVIWRREEFRREGARAARLVGPQEGLPASYATVVRLEQRSTGQAWSVLNVHLVWDAVQDGRKVPGRHVRYRYYVAQVRGLVRAVEREQRRDATRVLVVGDFNNDHADDRRLLRPGLAAKELGDVGLVSAWDVRDELAPGGGTSTLGAGYIDNVWSGGPATRVRTLLGVTGGQHHPVVAAYPR